MKYPKHPRPPIESVARYTERTRPSRRRVGPARVVGFSLLIGGLMVAGVGVGLLVVADGDDGPGQFLAASDAGTPTSSATAPPTPTEPAPAASPASAPTPSPAGEEPSPEPTAPTAVPTPSPEETPPAGETPPARPAPTATPEPSNGVLAQWRACGEVWRQGLEAQHSGFDDEFARFVELDQASCIGIGIRLAQSDVSDRCEVLVYVAQATRQAAQSAPGTGSLYFFQRQLQEAEAGVVAGGC